jgi:hypothetical protein
MHTDPEHAGDHKLQSATEGEKPEPKDSERHEHESDEHQNEVEVSQVGSSCLSRKLSFIEQGLDDYCANPSAAAFMQIYTCIYDLCNGREHKNAVCRAVYELYRRETEQCVRQLQESCVRLATKAHEPLHQQGTEALLEWRRLERRFHALQVSFGYLDRYHVPRASLESLATLRLSSIQSEKVEEHAQAMWSAVAFGLQNSCADVSFNRMHELVEVWGSLTRVVGMEEAAASASASHALREHLAATFTEGRFPLGRPSIANGTATFRVLGTQRPLARLILEFLSEQDLCKVYSVQSMQRV